MTAIVRRFDERVVPRSAACASAADVVRDVDLIMWSLNLHGIKRYFHQRFWEEETRTSEYAARIETSPRLESVSDHSWHIGYICNLLAPRYESLDRAKILQLALLHDVLEIFVGDQSPIGRDGTGRNTHAFNEGAAQRRIAAEAGALERYVAGLPADAAEEQKGLLEDYMTASTQEARFVKCVDKMQTLAFVLVKKSGRMEDKHIRFTMDYSEKGISYFPALEDHFRDLQGRILDSVAKVRGTSVAALRMHVFGSQLSFW